MTDFNIGDSEELVTVTRKRWDLIEFDKQKLEQRISLLNSGVALKISVSDPYDRFNDNYEYMTILSTDEAIASLEHLIEPARLKAYKSEEEKDRLKNTFQALHVNMNRIIKDVSWFNKRRTRRNLAKMFNEILESND